MSDYDHHAGILSGDELSDTLSRSMARGFEDARRVDRSGQADKTVKVLGLIEMDAGTAALIDGVWNDASTRMMTMLKPKTEQIARNVGTRAGMQGSALDKAATVAVVGVNAAATGSKYIASIAQGHKKHFDERAQLARTLAPALDRIKNNHSVFALLGVNDNPAKGGNEVIYAHRKRMNRVADMENSNNYLRMLVNVAPSVMTELPSAKRMWHGQDASAAIEPPVEPVAPRGDEGVTDALKSTGVMAIRGGAGPIAQRIIDKNERRLASNQQPNSALELILTLQEQVEYNPQSRSFQLPRESGSKSLSLEEYIAHVAVQHQKDMADLSPQHSEIREALREDLQNAVKPIAEAIRKGDLDAFALIHLVGERMLIKNNGRAIADEDEVLAHVEKLSGVDKPQPNMKPKEFYSNRGFTRDQFKEALGQLQGEEKQRLASMLPDDVLKDAGYSERDVREVRDGMRKTYHTMLTEAVMGLAAQSDAALKHEGMPQSQIKLLRKLEANIREEGVDAVKAPRNGSAHALDAEGLVLDFAIPQIMEDKTYLGTLVAKGKEVLQDERAANDDEAAHAKPRHGHAEKYGRRHANDDHRAADNDDGVSHAKREHARRAYHGESSRDFDR